ncbi:protein ENHANCED DISEASE RESISTANCE 2 isoform X4 [Physcomitrium patens]|uniref:protein ENHANCED DISEASE RESISTANCE 2 isoform X4 n=1 Tax=Physcomitrium patens TaxID=3218 RepID=UPI000D162958|nr:protein ENHANCED DISEASE RESISTANCE 2-like isoform X4 [Physcomitrium patens]|eukprot:XP_024370867.1 protein ENHANCED DISEASE RESISTANCE 2-like isoform X4 [Physcomitrella patens]
MLNMETYEPLEGSSCPSSPSLPRMKRKGCGGCSSIPVARWLSNSLKEKRNGLMRRNSGEHGRSWNRGREVEMKIDSSIGTDREGCRGTPGYSGWIYHVGTSSLGYPFCIDRFLVIKGKYVTMFKRNPVLFPRTVPIRSGIAGTHLMVEALGRRIFHGRALYVLRIFNRLDHSRQGELACNTSEEVDKLICAFKDAMEEAQSSSERIGSGRRIAHTDEEFDINEPRTHSKSVTRGIGKLMTLSRGLRIFKDTTASKAGKGSKMKAVGVIEASTDAIFEQIMSLNCALRYQWDILTGNLELVERIDGNADIVYGAFDPRYVRRFHGKRDFLFSRRWRRDQDGSYSITQVSTTHESRPDKPCFQRIDLSPGIWEIIPLPPRPGSGTPRSLVTQVIEAKPTGWSRWKRRHYSNFHKTIPCILLCRIAGLRELLEASPELIVVEAQDGERVSKVVKKMLETAHPLPEVTSPTLMKSSEELSVLEAQEEFYDAIMFDDEEENEGEENGLVNKNQTSYLECEGPWGVVLSLPSKMVSAPRAGRELDWNILPYELDPNTFYSSLRRTTSDEDCDGWSSPGDGGFMVRSETYNENNLKISGGDPLLKLVAVDWLKSDQKIDQIALHSSCCVQSAVGRKAPFILVINLQVCAKPKFSLVLYFVADKPIQPGSLLDQFANGHDAFRNSRFKLIPNIVEGYWMVKRAVGTKACLLGKAVTCNYLRRDNFLEIDVDIGSSSVARSVVGLALGYVTSVIVDLAILIEAKHAHELPEYLLGTVRINRIKVDSAVQFEGDAQGSSGYQHHQR